MSDDFQSFLTSKKKKRKKRLVDKLLLFLGELSDPNRKRETSMERVLKMAGVSM